MLNRSIELNKPKAFGDTPKQYAGVLFVGYYIYCGVSYSGLHGSVSCISGLRIKHYEEQVKVECPTVWTAAQSDQSDLTCFQVLLFPSARINRQMSQICFVCL